MNNIPFEICNCTSQNHSDIFHKLNGKGKIEINKDYIKFKVFDFKSIDDYNLDLINFIDILSSNTSEDKFKFYLYLKDFRYKNSSIFLSIIYEIISCNFYNNGEWDKDFKHVAANNELIDGLWSYRSSIIENKKYKWNDKMRYSINLYKYLNYLNKHTNLVIPEMYLNYGDKINIKINTIKEESSHFENLTIES